MSYNGLFIIYVQVSIRETMVSIQSNAQEKVIILLDNVF